MRISRKNEKMARGSKKSDFEDTIKISNLFSNLSENGKTMALVYLSALRDKELADQVNAAEAG